MLEDRPLRLLNSQNTFPICKEKIADLHLVPDGFCHGFKINLLATYEIGMFLFAGKLARILTDFFDFSNFCLAFCFQELFSWA